jgi:hypothetical protein
MTPTEAIEFMRANKILHFRCGDLELTLHPDGLAEPGDLPKMEVEPDLDDKERGTSGMTRKQQQDLLGHVIEAEFRKKA